jgi:hypothetical protein
MSHPIRSEAAHGRAGDMPRRGNQVRLVSAGEVVASVVNRSRNRDNPPVLENAGVTYNQAHELDEKIANRRPGLPDAVARRPAGGAASRGRSRYDLGGVSFHQTAVGGKCGKTWNLHGRSRRRTSRRRTPWHKSKLP